MTLSFYAKTGSQNNGHQYSLQIRKYDSSGNKKVVLQAFTVTSSWQRFTMTFPGDTATAINNTDDYQGMEINWHLCTGPDDLTSAQSTWGTPLSSYWAGVSGQSNFMDNTNNEFYLTGCQLEVGDTATSFEHRSRGDELARCQRYCVVIGGDDEVHLGTGNMYNSTNVMVSVHLPVAMRSKPSPSVVTSGGNWVQVYMGANGNISNASVSVGDSGGTCKDITAFRLYLQNAHSGLTAGQALWCHTIANAKLILSAEF